ncbi:MAG TPA: chemotaxis protein CheW [Polyangia bacterium]|nr:chemotaxis protein CheW [Polyangia bacterium]
MKLDLFSRLPGSSQADQERQLVEARIEDVRYGFDIMSVSEIVTPRRLIPVPGALPQVIGVADHRERVVPVVDLRRCLKLETGDGVRAKWVIVNSAGTDTAVLVDRVIGVIVVKARDRRERHPLMSGVDTQWIREVYGQGGGLVFEIDLAAVTGGAREAVAQALAAKGEP